MEKPLIIILCLQSLLIIPVKCLTCYSCTMSADEADRHCLEDPAGVITSPPTVKCSKKYCFVERIEYTDPKGQISSFIRGCTSGGDLQDGEVVSEDSITYYRSCTTNLCNVGDGTEPLSDGMDPQSANKIHGTIYAPGIGGSVFIGSHLTPAWLLIGASFLALTSSTYFCQG